MAEDGLCDNAGDDAPQGVRSRRGNVKGSHGDVTRVELVCPTCDISKRRTFRGSFQWDSPFGAHFKVCHKFLNFQSEKFLQVPVFKLEPCNLSNCGIKIKMPKLNLLIRERQKAPRTHTHARTCYKQIHDADAGPPRHPPAPPLPLPPPRVKRRHGAQLYLVYLVMSPWKLLCLTFKTCALAPIRLQVG